MAREIERLKAIKVPKLKKPGRYSDGGGLWLQVSGWGTRAWLFQYTSPVTGKVRQMGLGALHTVGLAEARELARRARNQVREGADPIEAKKQLRSTERREHAKKVTFKQAAHQFIENQRAGWKNRVHASQWESTLKTYAYPQIGNMLVGDVTKDLVLSIVQPIWQTKTETASRVRNRIERVLDLAIASEWREGPNPAAWKTLKEILPSPKKLRTVRHHPALPFTEIGSFIQRLRQTDGISARALEFTILCGSRTGEVINATWPEFDLTEGLWTIPAHRMKAGRRHVVPLSKRALEILRSNELPHENGNPHVFISAVKKGGPLSNMAMLELLKSIRPGLTVHGFRSTFRDWAAEETSFPNHIAEMALAHGIESKTESAYRRGELLKKRRQLMEAWAARCDQPDKAKADNVTPIRRAAS